MLLLTNHHNNTYKHNIGDAMGGYLFAIAAIASTPGGQEPEGVLIAKQEMFPRSVYYVRAKKLSVDVYQVTHVYLGSDRLLGSSFAGDFQNLRDALWVQLNLRGWGISGPTKPPSPAAYESGIFSVTRQAVTGRLVYSAVAGPLPLTPLLPCALVGDQSFADVAATADSLEALATASDRDPQREADRLLHSKNSRVSITILGLLAAHEKNPRVLDYLVALGKDVTLPVVTQQSLYSALARMKKGWQTSEDASRMIDRWFAGTWSNNSENANQAWDNSAEMQVIRWLQGMATDEKDRPEATIRLAVAGLSNAARSDRFKRELIAIVTPRIKAFWSTKVKAAAFDMLIDRIKVSGLGRDSVGAAKALEMLVPFSDGQRRVLQTLSATTMNIQVRDAIRDLLSRSD